ncbi:MAG TPA: hypothetical protein DEV81_15525 [Cyanobacteria bacterium UBA11049]|nr:hypothetical protein [Cyanobacteria bacterium UBA11049]
MVFISVTRLHLKSPLYLPAFLWHTSLSTWQIINTPGFLGGKFLGDDRGGSWTLTVWEKQAAMKHYRNSGAHRRVMPSIHSWCDEAAVVHWETDSYFPTWEEIHRRMIAQGHITRLSQPTAAQLEKKIPSPSSEALARVLRPRKKVQPVLGSQI